MRFPAGDLTVDVVVDIDRFELPAAGFLPGIAAETIDEAGARLAPEHFDPIRGRLLLAIQSFVLRSGGRTILLDSGVGEDKERVRIPEFHRRRETGFLDRLARVGVRPESVDLVFGTHLHVDHVGWNTRRQDGRWVPTFPCARYLAGRREFQYWREQDGRGDADAVQLPAFEDSVLPVFEAGRLELVDEGDELADGLSLIPLPGHTPGQLGVRAEGAMPAVFCGDAMHSPVQIVDPDLSSAGSTDLPEAARVRRSLLENAAQEGWMIVPAHFRGTRRVRIEHAAGGGFRPVFLEAGA